MNAMNMRRYRYLAAGAGVLLLGLIAWGVTRRVTEPAEVTPADPRVVVEASEPPPGVPRITATLFYSSADGEALVPVQREVALADGMVPQAREILAAQLQGAPAPYMSVIPEGTALRAFYTTDRGDAFVDLSPEISMRHPGGSSSELLTVYAIVNAVTANLPAVQRVQILIDGREVDTLAGHVDLRRPLERDVSVVREGR
jgi:spore germination protein GerM